MQNMKIYTVTIHQMIKKPRIERGLRVPEWMDKLYFSFSLFTVVLVMVLAITGIIGRSSAEKANGIVKNAKESPIAPIAAPLKITISEAQVEDARPVRKFIGEYTVTAYCPCAKCCGKWSNPKSPTTASGTSATQGVTVGADWLQLAPGTRIYIEGVGERIVQDKTAGWVNKKYDGMILDLYFTKHSDALSFGKQKLKVWMVSN